MHRYLSILKQTILQWKSLLIIILAVFIYITIPIYTLNYRYAFFMLTSKLGVIAKAVVIAKMLEALGTAFTGLDVFLMIVTGLLVGINIVLLLHMVKRLKQLASPVNVMVGGGGVLGLFSSGCASCGISLASVFGIGTGFVFLPFGNNLLYIVAIGISLYSLFYMLKHLDSSNYCVIKNK